MSEFLKRMRPVGLMVLVCGLPLACSGGRPLPVRPSVSYLCVPGIIQLAEARRLRQKFEPTPTSVPGRGGRDCWYRTDAIPLGELLSDAPDDGLVLMEINSATAQEIRIYQGDRLLHQGGAARSFESRTVPYRHSVFPIAIEGRTFPELLLHVRSTVPELPMTLWTSAAFHEATQREYYLLGVFLGIVAIMAAYNLMLGISIRERMYFFYVFYTISLGIYVLSEDGLLNQWLRLEENQQPHVFVLIMAPISGSALLFVRSFLETGRVSQWLSRAMFWHACASLVVVPIIGVLWIEQRGPIMNLNGAVVLVLVVTAMLRGLLRRDPQARILAAAGFVFMFFIVFRLLWLVGVPVGSDFLRHHGTKFGAAIELSMLALGLAWRYNRLRDDFVRTRAEHARERERLLGEVHDTIGARLSAALMHIGKAPGQAELRAILESALERARDLSALIQLAGRTEFTLASEIRGLVDTYAGLPGARIQLSFDERLNELDLGQRIDVSRLLQEWVSNSVRHAGARTLRVEFHLRRGAAVLRVLADGLAFNWRSEQNYDGPGSGLRGMQNRVERLRGKARSFARGRLPVRSTENAGERSGSAFVLRFPFASPGGSDRIRGQNRSWRDSGGAAPGTRPGQSGAKV
jgi:signal transduction histidine kinase